MIRRPMTNPWFPPLGLAPDFTGTVPGSTAWPNANTATYIPVIFPSSCTITALSFRGGNATGNFDLGLYLDDLTRIQSTGSTAMSNAEKTLTFTNPLRVKAGRRYYAALVCSAGGTILSGTFTAINLLRIGAFQQATALPLPSTATPATIVQTILPYFKFTVAGL